MSKKLEKYSFGIGDRFEMEGKAQLRGIIKMQELGVSISPVWNKSNREHQTVGSKPESVRREADLAVRDLQFKGDYFVDADHINLDTVDPYISGSDFFTIDVAQYIGKRAENSKEKEFFQFFEKYTAGFYIKGIDRKIEIKNDQLQKMTDKFLYAMKQAGDVYFHIKAHKEEKFYTEVSIDEVDNPQTLVEVFFILAALAFYKVQVNTIAPKFTGRFNKGVDYEGVLKQFEKEFEEDILVLLFAIEEFGLPKDLKLSVHSGSDKFSVYPIMKRLIQKHRSGLHVKTAGTTWLEEIIGLAESGGEGFEFALEIYKKALERYDELTAPYATVLEIDKSKLPTPLQVQQEGGKAMANAIRHNKDCEAYNLHLRQLMHCAYKIAAEESKFSDLLNSHRRQIEKNVTFNIFERHLKPLFLSS